MNDSNLTATCSEFSRTGLFWLVDRWTGEMRAVSGAEYDRLYADGLLGGYIVRLSERAARGTAAVVWAKNFRRN